MVRPRLTTTRREKSATSSGRGWWMTQAMHRLRADTRWPAIVQSCSADRVLPRQGQAVAGWIRDGGNYPESAEDEAAAADAAGDDVAKSMVLLCAAGSGAAASMRPPRQWPAPSGCL